MAGCSTRSVSAAGFPAATALQEPDGSAPPDPAARDFACRLGHEFVRRSLLAEALTHPSAPGAERRQRGQRRQPAMRGYERLEFLGDRVLGLVVADLLWHRFADESEGLLTRRLAELVRRDTLARIAGRIGLGRHLVLSPAESAAGAAANPGILADALEALVAAIYLDGGFAAATAFVHRWWKPLIDAMRGPPQDPKTALQEWAQGRGLPLPTYALVGASGPAHAPRFTVAVSVPGAEPAAATASSKRAAETQAAAALLDRLAAGP
jgi:ribonuclease III